MGGLFLLVLLGLLAPGAFWASPGGMLRGGPVAPTALHTEVRGAPATSGDLIVTSTNSPYVISGPANGLSNFIVQGNVSVATGATLVLNHVVLTVSEFIADSGTFAQRTAHIYTVQIQGTVRMTNASIATSYAPINPFSKLYLNVSNGGQLLLSNSSLEFPGQIAVYGAGSTLSLTNGSKIRANPAAAVALGENETINNDTKFAPSLSASGGAHVILIDSQINNTYADNVSHTGMPGPARPVLDNTVHTLNGGSGASWSNFALQDTNSENLTRAVLYRTISAASVTINYTAAVNCSTGLANFVFGGTYGFGPVAFTAFNGNSVTLPLPAGAVAAINAVTFPVFLNDLLTGGVTVTLGNLNRSTNVPVSPVEFRFVAALDYNLTFSGPGTMLTAIDSSIQLNFNLTPGTAVPNNVYPPNPWDSNKLLLTNGAAAYFASVTITRPIVQSYGNDSAILPDATSSAVFYRWLAVPVHGAGAAPAPGALANAFYGLDTNQANNATATAFNNLASANPLLATYAASWDASHGIATYGETGLNGVASMLLATSYLTGATLPDGDFLGGYHIGVYVPGVTGSTQWIDASTTPYPNGMDPATADSATTPVVLPSFSTQLSVGSTAVLVGGVTVGNDTVAIGQNLTIQVTIQNSGTGPVTTSTSDLEYERPHPAAPRVVLAATADGPIAHAASITVNLTWLVNESVTGHNGTVHATFYSAITWNGGVAPVGGTVIATVPVTIVPAYIALTWNPPTTQLKTSQETGSTGTVHFAGRGNATINVTAIGSNGVRYVLTSVLAPNGVYTAYLVPLYNMGPGAYAANISAYYNGRTVYVDVPAGITVAGATSSTAPTPFYDISILGLPLWVWLAIAGAVIVGIVLFLTVVRRQAKGKLVECGECGALIPEAATACPECGAEFESDLVRCSRCGSTIPSNSTQCPECSAQLLGPDTADPERQGYQDFIEKFRLEAKKELGDNYGEGAFWDWWKRQSSYVSFNQWKLQQAQGSRTGMAAPPAAAAPETPGPAPTTRGTAAPPTMSPSRGTPPATPAAAPSAVAPSVAEPAAMPAGGPAMKACSNCGKEIPPDYLVCPFCGAVTR